MLKITKPSSDRLDVELSGVLTADTMREGLERFIEQSEDITNGRMLYTIPEFAMPTLGALAVEFQHIPKLFGMIRNFDKCAVLSDAAWIRNAAEIEGAVIPGLEIKSFPLSSSQAAEAWLSKSQTGQDDTEEENFPV
ncbi:MAG: STAS/SEC14 domain-containing protein [Roseobacter sp.]|jgi:hypothetical protein|nr:STAS/SEC14 domain-containing protein [Roseobacter sp.]